MQVRLFNNESDTDYESIVALDNDCWPDYPTTVEEKRHADSSWEKKYMHVRLLAEQDGQVIANATYMEPPWSYRPRKFHWNVQVHPNHRRRGIGGRLHDEIMRRLAPLDPVTLTAQTREDQEDALRFLAKRGYQARMREPISRLDVDAFDPAPFALRAEKVRAAGFEILPLADLTDRFDDWKRRLYELEWELLQDVPVTEPLTKQPYDVWEQRVLQDPGFLPEGNMVAVDGDRWVGVSGLWRAEAAPKKLYTGLTGVARSHRRLGLATAMKLRAIAFARTYGAQVIETDNEENNPMYQINMMLGFTPQPAWLAFQKDIEASPDDGADTAGGGRPDRTGEA